VKRVFGAGPWETRFFHVRVMAVVSALTGFVVLVGALPTWSVERSHPGTNIVTFWDAVWWAMETITTVGYGDHHPTTPLGRVVAGGLMIAGIALVGVITATVVTWFFAELEWVKNVREFEQVEERTEVTLEEVLAELRGMNERLDRIEGSTPKE
jgi:voltage-gated potassium channel